MVLVIIILQRAHMLLFDEILFLYSPRLSVLLLRSISCSSSSAAVQFVRLFNSSTATAIRHRHSNNQPPRTTSMHANIIIINSAIICVAKTLLCTTHHELINVYDKIFRITTKRGGVSRLLLLHLLSVLSLLFSPQ